MPYHQDGHSRRHGILIAVVTVLCFAAAILVIHFLGSALEEEPKPETRGNLEERFAPSLTAEVDGRVWAYRELDLENLLIMGVDTENINETHVGYRDGGQSDFLLLLVMDKTNNKVTPLHLDRDTMTPIQIFGVLGNYTGVRVMQIALSHAMGRTPDECAQNTIWAVRNLLMNIPIEHYIAFDFNSVGLVNDAVGGITVTIDEDLTAADEAFVEGTTLTLMGDQAIHYVRSRMNVSDGKNTSRMRRQRQYMSAALNGLKAKISADKNFAATLFDSLGEHMATDLSRSALINIAYRASQYDWSEFVTMDGNHEVSESTGFMTFYPDEEQLQKMTLDTFFELYK